MRFNLRPARIVAVLMLVAVFHVYVFASGALSSSSSNALLGRLVTTSNRPVLVNGGEAVTGTVILSGAQVMTSAAGQAIVQLEKVASVTIAPNSFVTLNFDAKSVLVKVASGNATVVAAEGVTGSVVDANGKTVVPGVPVAPAGGNSAKNWGIAGVGIGSAAFIWALIGWNKANDADDAAKAAQAANAALAAQLAALRACLAGQTASPVKVCTSF